MTWQADEPYNDLPHLPPQSEIETRTVLKLAIEARAALASLEQAAQGMPNAAVLINSIGLLEAQASSEIENIVTTTDELFKYAQAESAATDPATREALRYRTALYEGFRSVQVRPLSVSTAVEVCTLIKQRDMGIRRLAGTYIGNPATHQAIYTPPTGESTIRDKLTNWQDFIHGDDDLDPLVTMAVAHYQFEAIHPFEDGNGRTGRVLNVLLLVSAGLLSQPILYLSKYIIENKSSYYRLLQGVTEDQDWQSWTLFMLEGIRQTSVSTVHKIRAIKELQQHLHEVLRDTMSGGVNADFLAVLFEQPYCRIASVMSRCSVSRPTATSWLNGLVEVGVLLKVPVGRERLYVNTAFMDLLTRDEGVAAAEAPTLF
ncbi:Fic family protein [Cryobacterium sp. 1639]|uniref:Fic family protein n=1 Tax=Cryobacterium inferilacus TaxID=2866629 RepID=UPI001C732035|nr:Fic family protein [Cryobacterium sp. 1639]MBX0302012.1 Fic family protein [Cryobacterium sp. 1639]